MSSKHEVLKCRSCEVAGKPIMVDTNINGIECPTCGVRVEGDAFRTMHAEQVEYLRRKVLQDLLRGTMPERQETGVTVSHQFTEID